MKKVIFSLIFIVVSLFAKVDFSEMSTEELLAMIGYVKPANQKSFQKELEFRYPKMSDKEKTIYIKNLKKIKK
ncbi:DUF1104 domain-containing protein [Sulfurospirillum arcachonense]|uniref:DUF1104 domain-containing protein n=1 Tax=Sulfurospirillum arcachonense TaxID=57666 RepID=UPI00046A2A4A|nr:DUF1104 domain-containing protein [Sulfurospirillum arcachonense]